MIVTAIPLYHVLALMVNFLSYFSIRAENWLVTNPRDIGALIDVLEAARPTVFVGVNTLYAGLAAHPRMTDVDWSRLRLSAGGGAAVLATTSERWKQVTGSFIRQGYGLSESPIVSFNPDYIVEFNSTAGLPLPSTDIKLLDDDNEAGIGEAGEICVEEARRSWRVTGKIPRRTRSLSHTTATFALETSGYSTARIPENRRQKKDMVIVSGFKVYPNEVEAVATSFPGVAECACVGVPDEKTGEAVKLFVVKAPTVEIDEAALIAHWSHWHGGV